MSTNVLSAKDIKREWHIVDAKGKVLGRIATDIATKLSGKGKTAYVPYLDTGDFVVVTNASHVRVTGKKADQKRYVRHSGYPGGLKVEIFSDLLKRKPEDIILHAVKGMLPKSKLGKKMIKKLYVFPSSTHPYAKQLKMERQEEAVETNG